MKKVLITGDDGFIGRHLVDEYVNMGFIIDKSYNNECNKSGITHKLVKLTKWMVADK